MEEYKIQKQTLDNIANAINAKTGQTVQMTPLEMPAAIQSIPSGSGTLIPKSITQNGTYNASDDSADGYSSVTVDVSGGGGETCTLTVTNEGPPFWPGGLLCITTPTGVIRINDFGAYEIVKGTLVYKTSSTFTFESGIHALSTEVGEVISDCVIGTQ